MADFTDDNGAETEEDLRGLEDEKGAEAAPEEEAGRPRQPQRERGGNRPLPSPLYRVKASHSNETYFAYFEGELPPEASVPGEEGEPPRLAPRTLVLAPTRYGRDICELQGLVKEPGRIGPDELLKIERVATAEDLERAEANKEKERKAFELCREKIETRKLPMKLVAAHYLLEEPKVIFFFSAESRVDFRELVKDLVSVFKMRIELRQIGVRDEARITGGCGVCGRVLCCHGVTDKLTPVSIKMAKDQNLSLNSMKISGPCGRLLCCLAYEYGFYRDARRELPGEGARFVFEGVQFRVIEVNALSGSVKVSGEDGRVLEMPAARFVHSEGRWQVRPEAEPEASE